MPFKSALTAESCYIGTVHEGAWVGLVEGVAAVRVAQKRISVLAQCTGWVKKVSCWFLSEYVNKTATAIWTRALRLRPSPSRQPLGYRATRVFTKLNSWPTFSPYLYNGVWSELTCCTSLSHSRLACSRLRAHIQPSVNNPRRQTRPIHDHELS